MRQGASCGSTTRPSRLAPVEITWVMSKHSPDCVHREEKRSVVVDSLRTEDMLGVDASAVVVVACARSQSGGGRGRRRPPLPPSLGPAIPAQPRAAPVCSASFPRRSRGVAVADGGRRVDPRDALARARDELCSHEMQPPWWLRLRLRMLLVWQGRSLRELRRGFAASGLAAMLLADDAAATSRFDA